MNTKNNKLKRINRNKKQINRLKRRINRNNRRIRNQIRIIKRNRRIKMPAAMTSTFRKQFSILQQSGTSMRVHGRDLIYKIPELISNNSGDVMTVIPCNPAYWTGTRISAIASGYQNYRPIMFKVTYVPQCAVTQQGNVLAGTLWAMSPNPTDLQQTLRTSNGGMLVQCYKTHSVKIKLGSNLQFNLFRMGGKFDQESNPFIFMAIAIGTYSNNNETKINPGYFYVEYEYELKNPIGNTIKYYNSGLIQDKDAEVGYTNETLINCTNLNNINLGAIIQKDNGKYFWNEKEVNITKQMYVWYFNNEINNDDNITLQLPIDPSTAVTTSQQVNAHSKNYYYNDIGDNTGLLIEISNTDGQPNIVSLDFIFTQGDLYKLTEQQFDEITNDYNFEYINTTVNADLYKLIYVTDIHIQLINSL